MEEADLGGARRWGNISLDSRNPCRAGKLTKSKQIYSVDVTHGILEVVGGPWTYILTRTSEPDLILATIAAT